MVSIRAFAKQIGVSEITIRRAVNSGKFSLGWDAASKTIDETIAINDEWVKSVSVVKKNGISKTKFVEKVEKKKVGQKVSKQDNKQKKSVAPKDTSNDNSTTNFEQLSRESELLNDLKITSDMSLADAMKVNEIISAELARLKLLEAERVLVRKVDVEKVLFAFGSQLKKSITKLPEMIVDEVLASGNKVSAINIMKEAINEILVNYASFNEITINE